MNRIIIVSSNCQTGGIAAALAAILPNDTIIPVPLPNVNNNLAVEKLITQLQNAEIWISSGCHNIVNNIKNANLSLIKIPIIYFGGFHPDLVYARQISTGTLTLYHYNSAIAVWAYKHKLTVEDTESLFNPISYTELGYLNNWESSVNNLRNQFNKINLDFKRFFLFVKRQGLFMHAINHPMQFVLTQLAKQVSLLLGMDASIFEKNIVLNDGLANTIWPIYPEIGNQLALYSSYEWKINKKYYCNKKSYLKFVYTSYLKQNIQPNDIVALGVQEKLYDQVLGQQIK